MEARREGNILKHKEGYNIAIKYGEHYIFGSCEASYGFYGHCMSEFEENFDISIQYGFTNSKIIGNIHDNPERVEK